MAKKTENDMESLFMRLKMPFQIALHRQKWCVGNAEASTVANSIALFLAKL